MIALTGCCLSTKQYDQARSILRTFMKYCRRGLMPNLFPEAEGVRKYGKDFWGEIDLTKVFQELFGEKNVSCSREKAAVIANCFRTLSREKLKVYNGVKETLKKLREEGKRVFLLSNAQSDFTRPEIELLGLTDCFDGILISSEEGCRKPSPVFFRRLTERYGLVAGELSDGGK